MGQPDVGGTVALVCGLWFGWGALCFFLGRWTGKHRIRIEDRDYPRKLAGRQPAAPYVTPPLERK